MAILTFTAKDKLASRIMPSGWYGAIFKELKDPTKSGSGKSFNMMATFVIVDDLVFADKELEICFNTGSKQPTVMGTLYLMPHTMIPYLSAAVMNVDIDKVPDKIDTETLNGNRLDIKVEKIIHEGVVLNTISAFLPFGDGRKQATAELPF